MGFGGLPFGGEGGLVVGVKGVGYGGCGVVFSPGVGTWEENLDELTGYATRSLFDDTRGWKNLLLVAGVVIGFN